MKIAPGPARRAESRGKDRSTLMLSTPPPEGRELLELRDTGLARQYHQERMASAVYLLLQVAAMIGRAHILQPGCSGHPVRAAPAAIGRKRAMQSSDDCRREDADFMLSPHRRPGEPPGRRGGEALPPSTTSLK